MVFRVHRLVPSRGRFFDAKDSKPLFYNNSTELNRRFMAVKSGSRVEYPELTGELLDSRLSLLVCLPDSINADVELVRYLRPGIGDIEASPFRPSIFWQHKFGHPVGH